MPRTLPPLKGNEKVWHDILPTETLRQHGRWVYMFRNTQTNQIVYTPNPRIEQRTLKQLPFIGKHSVPARIRPDLWTAHCRVGPFPHKKQGLDALKKLRELRKLHEVHWNVTNPGFRGSSKKKLIRLIMDQRKNAAADLAKVLSIQEKIAQGMEEARETRREEQDAFLEKRWAELRELARQADEGRVTELQKRVEQWTKEIKSKEGRPDAQKILENKMKHNRQEIRRLNQAKRLVDKLVAEDKRIEEKHAKLVAHVEKCVADMEAAGKPEKAQEFRQQNTPQKEKNELYFSLLPKALKSNSELFSLDGIECQWADLVDAEYAADAWPADIIHEPLKGALGTIKVQTAEEYEMALQQQMAEVEAKAQELVEESRREEENRRRKAEGLPPLEEPKLVAEPEQKTGLAKYTSWIKNPFKRASA